MLALVLWVVFYGSAARIYVRRHLPPPTTPAGPPIEAIAADLKRLRAATLSSHPARATSVARPRWRRTTMRWPRHVWPSACPTPCPAAAGTDREAERLRVETLLEAAGLRFSPPR